MKSYKEWLKEDFGGMHDAHMQMAASVGQSYTGKGHYIKKDGRIISKRHDNVDSAHKDWASRPEHERTGSKIVHE